jgi:hypothetical protein
LVSIVNRFGDENGCFGSVEGAIEYQRGKGKRKRRQRKEKETWNIS